MPSRFGLKSASARSAFNRSGSVNFTSRSYRRPSSRPAPKGKAFSINSKNIARATEAARRIQAAYQRAKDARFSRINKIRMMRAAFDKANELLEAGVYSEDGGSFSHDRVDHAALDEVTFQFNRANKLANHLGLNPLQEDAQSKTRVTRKLGR